MKKPVNQLYLVREKIDKLMKNLIQTLINLRVNTEREKLRVRQKKN